jgi:hypothetical protein
MLVCHHRRSYSHVQGPEISRPGSWSSVSNCPQQPLTVQNGYVWGKRLNTTLG